MRNFQAPHEIETTGHTRAHLKRVLVNHVVEHAAVQEPLAVAHGGVRGGEALPALGQQERHEVFALKARLVRLEVVSVASVDRWHGQRR